jgi:hypothetical protein
MEKTERDVEILKYKLSEIDEKLVAFKKHNISEAKIKKLEIKKEYYLNQLSTIL